MRLKITTLSNPQGHLRIKLAGRLDSDTVKMFDKTVTDLTEGITDLDLDLSEVEYLSSAGLRSLLLARKWANKHDVKIHILNPTEAVLEVFDTTGFDRLIEI